jgi:hypothetical protein
MKYFNNGNHLGSQPRGEVDAMGGKVLAQPVVLTTEKGNGHLSRSIYPVCFGLRLLL